MPKLFSAVFRLHYPGMTRAQAQRLWGLDEQTCTMLLESLTTERFLCRKSDGTYGRIAETATAFPPPRMMKYEGAAYPNAATRSRAAAAHRRS